MSTESFQKTTLSQGLDVVRLLVRAGNLLGVTQVAEMLHLPKSSAHRLLQILTGLGFVEQNPVNMRYGVNPRIFGFIHDVASQFGPNTKVDPILQGAAARLKCSAYLSMLGGRDTFVVCAAGDDGGTTHLGSHGPAYATSVGKILVAQRPSREWAGFAPRAEESGMTPHTNLDPERFYKELRAARSNGFAWNLRETAASHASVAAVVPEPLLRSPRMAVALLVSYHEIAVHDRETLEREVRLLAGQISDALSYAPAKTGG